MAQIKQISLKTRIVLTVLVTILFWVNLIWDYLHQGIPSHYLLHRKDFPEISNWWGGIAVPILTWFLLYRIAKRVNNNASPQNKAIKSIYRFLGALLFGILLSTLFTKGSIIPNYMVLGAVVTSFLFPLYRAEFILGYVLGMSYTFGGFIAVASGIVFWGIFSIAYLLIRRGIVYIVSQMK